MHLSMTTLSTSKDSTQSQIARKNKLGRLGNGEIAHGYDI